MTTLTRAHDQDTHLIWAPWKHLDFLSPRAQIALGMTVAALGGLVMYLAATKGLADLHPLYGYAAATGAGDEPRALPTTTDSPIIVIIVAVAVAGLLGALAGLVTAVGGLVEKIASLCGTAAVKTRSRRRARA